jgi:hypothetical protein
MGSFLLIFVLQLNNSSHANRTKIILVQFVWFPCFFSKIWVHISTIYYMVIFFAADILYFRTNDNLANASEAKKHNYCFLKLYRTRSMHFTNSCLMNINTDNYENRKKKKNCTGIWSFKTQYLGLYRAPGPATATARAAILLTSFWDLHGTDQPAFHMEKYRQTINSSTASSSLPYIKQACESSGLNRNSGFI